MHVLNGLNTRRKSPKPSSSYIRKVSLSGCSIHSDSSTSTAPHSRSNSDASNYDPLRLHPIIQPPPRLHERPYIASSCRHHQQTPRTFYYDGMAGAGGDWSGYGVSIFEYDDDDSEDDDDDEVVEQGQSNSSMPPMSGTADNDDDGDYDEDDDDSDYLFLQSPVRRRPAGASMARSHWSESTIHTLTPAPGGSSGRGTPRGERREDAAEHTRSALPNFSRKHANVPARPLMRTLDSVENMVKSGGWKRRALILDMSDAALVGGA